MSRDRRSGAKHDSLKMHKKVKEATGIFKVSNNGRLHDNTN